MTDELKKIRMKKMEGLKKIGGSKMETEINVNDSNFVEEVIEKSRNIPVVADFWAQSCMPCIMLGPVLEKLAKEYNGKFVLAKIDLEQNQQKAEEYEISSIPNVKLFKGGKIVDEFIGAIPEEQIRSWLDKHV